MAPPDPRRNARSGIGTNMTFADMAAKFGSPTKGTKKADPKAMAKAAAQGKKK